MRAVGKSKYSTTPPTTQQKKKVQTAHSLVFHKILIPRWSTDSSTS